MNRFVLMLLKTLKQKKRDLVRYLRAYLSGKELARGLVWLSLENAHKIYGSDPNIQIHPIKIGENFTPHPPKCLQEDTQKSVDCRHAYYNTVLLDVRRSDYSFRNNHLLDNNLRVIYEPDLDWSVLPIRNQVLADCQHVEGTVAYLSNTNMAQYAHWLEFQLPLLLSYWHIVKPDEIDYYYIGDGPIADFIEESLGVLGIRKEKIINFPCTCDRALIAIKKRKITFSERFTGIEMDKPSYEFLNHMFIPRVPPEIPPLPKRIYVGRGNVKARKVLNEDAVIGYLETLGFVAITMEGKTMQEEADIFGNAEAVIAPHGSALHNLLFAKPGTKVIEIFPDGYYEWSNYIISHHGQCDYYHLMGDRLYNLSDAKYQDVRVLRTLDIKVNIDKLQKVCAMAGLVNCNSPEILVP